MSYLFPYVIVRASCPRQYYCGGNRRWTTERGQWATYLDELEANTVAALLRQAAPEEAVLIRVALEHLL